MNNRWGFSLDYRMLKIVDIAFIEVTCALDGGREVFSNGLVGDSLKGVRSMYWVDANGDGKINGADPVYHEIKVWRDNGNGVVDPNEMQSLAALGISELDYRQNRFTQNGELRLMASPDIIKRAAVAANDGRMICVA